MRVVFSDCDGTLLDHYTYSYEKACEGISLLRERDIPLVLVSSKTIPEMKALHSDLRLSSPFIFENGGGIAFPGSGDFIIDISGMDLDELKAGIPVVENELGSRVRIMQSMDISEIACLTGLSIQGAELSRRRKTSIPFIIVNGKEPGRSTLDAANRALEGLGVEITRGGRFYHLITAGMGKGSAVKKVIDYYRGPGHEGVCSCGIGDSENDIPMLQAVDVPFVVRKPDGSAVHTGIRHVVCTKSRGPEGFSEAVRSFVNRHEEGPPS